MGSHALASLLAPLLGRLEVIAVGWWRPMNATRSITRASSISAASSSCSGRVYVMTSQRRLQDSALHALHWRSLFLHGEEQTGDP